MKAKFERTRQLLNSNPVACGTRRAPLIACIGLLIVVAVGGAQDASTFRANVEEGTKSMSFLRNPRTKP